MTQELIALGVVVKPHGIKGEVRVHLFNPDSTLLQSYSEVMLRSPEGEVTVVSVSSFGRGKDYIRFQIDGSDSREVAESLRGHELCLPREALPDLAEGEHYLVDLEGLEVRGEGGEPYGQVERVVTLPTVDCLRVPCDGGYVEIPIMDRYVTNIDYERGVIEVAFVEELPVEKKSRRRRPKPKGKA